MDRHAVERCTCVAHSEKHFVSDRRVENRNLRSAVFGQRDRNGPVSAT
jgi:hypothetical protein